MHVLPEKSMLIENLDNCGCFVSSASLTWPGCSPTSPCLPCLWGSSWPGCLHGQSDAGSSLCLPASAGVRSVWTHPWTHGGKTRWQVANRWLLNVSNNHIRHLVLLLRSTWRPYLTTSPASRKALAVPPEATRDRPTSTSSLAKSTSPVLSDTLRRAERRD